MSINSSAIYVVLDTNILVSALWSRNNRLTRILELVLSDKLIPCHNAEIMDEYKEVLSCQNLAFHFGDARVRDILEKIEVDGLSVVVKPSSIPLFDEDDRAFYDVAKACGCYLITSNKRHYPKDDEKIVDPFDFLHDYENGNKQ